MFNVDFMVIFMYNTPINKEEISLNNKFKLALTFILSPNNFAIILCILNFMYFYSDLNKFQIYVISFFMGLLSTYSAYYLSIKSYFSDIKLSISLIFMFYGFYLMIDKLALDGIDPDGIFLYLIACCLMTFFLNLFFFNETITIRNSIWMKTIYEEVNCNYTELNFMVSKVKIFCKNLVFVQNGMWYNGTLLTYDSINKYTFDTQKEFEELKDDDFELISMINI